MHLVKWALLWQTALTKLGNSQEANDSRLTEVSRVWNKAILPWQVKSTIFKKSSQNLGQISLLSRRNRDNFRGCFRGKIRRVRGPTPVVQRPRWQIYNQNVFFPTTEFIVQYGEILSSLECELHLIIIQETYMQFENQKPTHIKKAQSKTPYAFNDFSHIYPANLFAIFLWVVENLLNVCLYFSSGFRWRPWIDTGSCPTAPLGYLFPDGTQYKT